MSSSFLWLTALLSAGPADPPAQPFAIEVVDEQTGRGVPLVELRTVHGIRLVTDSGGIAAFSEPGLMDQTVFFDVRAHGYEFPKDGFGFRGKALPIRSGGSARLAIRRTHVAERLYRVTGAGLYHDTILVNRRAPIRQPLLNARVLGSDSVVDVVYHGKLHWFWGDTNRPSYPLGNFDVPGATSHLPADGGLDPEIGVDLDYFIGDDGFARPMAQMPGAGPTWIFGLVVLRDRAGRERMFATYQKVRNLLDVYERGLVEFDDEALRFRHAATFAPSLPIYPGGNPFLRMVDGVEYIYFATPYPLTRVRAEPESLMRPDRYEAFTSLAEGARLDRPRIDRHPDGSVRYGWKRDTPAIFAPDQAKLVEAGLLKRGEALLHLQDPETGRAVTAHSGSVFWNVFRGRWVMIAVESGGESSYLGEVWFAEADTPTGPWVYTRKVGTHDRYSFYNPKQHPAFDKDGGRVIFFEGTYTQTFSGNTEATPRYDYNQVMYRLDLSDARLNLPVPIYHREQAGVTTFDTGRRRRPGDRIAFFALEKAGTGTVPVSRLDDPEAGPILKVGPLADGPEASVLFYALPADVKAPPSTTTPLYEFILRDGKVRTYSTEETSTAPGARRSERPVCRVWKNPLLVSPPWD